jgi:hypothetical protein
VETWLDGSTLIVRISRPMWLDISERTRRAQLSGSQAGGKVTQKGLRSSLIDRTLPAITAKEVLPCGIWQLLWPWRSRWAPCQWRKLVLT